MKFLFQNTIAGDLLLERHKIFLTRTKQLEQQDNPKETKEEEIITLVETLGEINQRSARPPRAARMEISLVTTLTCYVSSYVHVFLARNLGIYE